MQVVINISNYSSPKNQSKNLHDPLQRATILTFCLHSFHLKENFHPKSYFEINLSLKIHSLKMSSEKEMVHNALLAELESVGSTAVQMFNKKLLTAENLTSLGLYLEMTFSKTTTHWGQTPIQAFNEFLASRR